MDVAMISILENVLGSINNNALTITGATNKLMIKEYIELEFNYLKRNAILENNAVSCYDFNQPKRMMLPASSRS